MQFVPEGATSVAPLTKPLRKDAVEPQQTAFEDLMNSVTKRPLLAFSDLTRPFRLITDSSMVGLGSEVEGAYPSKINSATVANYSITWCYDVGYEDLRVFRLHVRMFTLVTDHANLKWRITSKDLTGRVHRWTLQLHEYGFEIEYRPGKDNVVADALSNVLVGDGPSDEQRSGRKLTDAPIRAQQAGDGIGYIWAEDGGHRVVLLPTLWVNLLCTAHASIFACNLRTPQTYARISAVYWWPDMQAHESEGEGSDPSASHSGWDAGNRWAIDVAGPLSVAENNNRYVVTAHYAVVETVADHTTSAIAKFKVEKLVLA
ncbi:Pol Polyprotein [Phytophthora megakarya]|uniref:Pol Polyprotein n=1 Tax=Phytophthora megakarya TaxID=4795 RepID=A0A225W0G4_9STRA|nr:Pol Polyprotein [Phytophthora megakarya]